MGEQTPLSIMKLRNQQVVHWMIITDFLSATDKIDVSAIFGGSGPSSLLTTAFTSGGDAEVLYTGGTVSFDVDGNGAAEFAIALTGASYVSYLATLFSKTMNTASFTVRIEI